METTPTVTQEDIRAENLKFLQRLDDSSEGEVKAASAAGTNMLRRRIREEGFTRRIIPPQMARNEDLNRVLENDRPVIIEDMEPGTPGALSIPFNDATLSTPYYGDKFPVYFNVITTREYVKDINELRTYKMDLRQVVTDNALKDVQTEEDGNFIAGCDVIVGSTSGVGASGVQQNFNISGGITRQTYKTVLSILEDQNLNNGIILINRKTAKEFLGWDRSEIGGDLAERLFTDGLSALTEQQVAFSC